MSTFFRTRQQGDGEKRRQGEGEKKRMGESF